MPTPELQHALNRIDHYLAEHTGYGEPDLIHAYWDGAGLIHAMLWASDLHAVRNALRGTACTPHPAAAEALSTEN